MKHLYTHRFVSLIFIAFCSTLYADTNELQIDARGFLHLYNNNLTESHKAVVEGSISKEFVRFRGYSLVDYTIYRQMSKQEIASIPKPLIFFSGFFREKPIYSEFGGVSVDAYTSDDDTPIHLNFQGRYLSDVIAIGSDRFYALCALSMVNRCLLLGIGERW